MRFAAKVVLSLILLSGGAATLGQTAPKEGQAADAPMTPWQAVERAADKAPDGVPGVFSFRVRATGKDGRRVYFNSEQDYRDPRNLTLAILPAAYASLEVKLQQDPRQALIGKQLLVTGVARRVTIFFTVDGKPTDKYYYQTHVEVRDAAQIVIVDAPVEPATPVTTLDVVLPPETGLGRRSGADLTAAWWQWAMSSPDRSNPVADTTGEHCAVQQEGDVWFLAGGFGSARIHRRCHVPAGKHLFFPIVNTMYYPRQSDNGYTCEQAKANADYATAGSLDLFAIIDGQSVATPKAHRIRTAKCFDVFARVPASAGAYRAYPSATDGYWLLVKPLAKGTHTLAFGGRGIDAATGNNRNLQDIVYEIVVD